MSLNKKILENLQAQKILSKEDALKLYDTYKGDAFEIVEHLFKSRVADKNKLGKVYGDSIGVSYVNLDKTLFESKTVTKLPHAFSRKNHIIPLYEINGVVTVAMASPLNLDIIDEAKRVMGCPVSAVFSFPDEINDTIDIQYQTDDSLCKFVDQLAENELFRKTDKITSEQLKQCAGDKAVIEFCRNILLLAVKERSSDIHIDPQNDVIYIRFRVDGVLHDRLKLDKNLHNPLVSRLKVMANLDITERRRPQDGRLALDLLNKSIDFRLSSVPTIYGEKIVLRALGQIEKKEVLNLSDLDFSKSNFNIIKRIIDVPNGVFFVTGPTGSGKSTTIFSVLKNLNKPDVNIMTAEDPVEYRLSRVNQVQINPKIGFDFAAALRSFLRQDPDVILIGEIRDLETAKIASQAALTGHLVLATMHTNSALQALTRLIEIGVEPFLVAPSIIGVMAQRIVRRICSHCKEKYEVEKEIIDKYFIWDKQTRVFFYRGKGCAECNNTGYHGRLAIHELFIINDNVRVLIAKEASILSIQDSAKKSGFKTMRYDGIKKVLMGYTTIEEVERAAMED